MQKKKQAEILNFNSRRQPVPQAEAAERSETLRQTPSFLNMVIENIPAMVAVKDARDLRFVLVNRHYEELTGILRQDALGKNDFDLFPKEQAEFFVARDREVLASGKAQVIPEEQITTLHKGTRTLRTFKMPVLNDAGRPKYLLAMSQDITDQKQTEEALAASERRWAFALESAGQGVWEADIANNKVYYSPMWKQIRGFDLNEEVDSNVDAWLARVHPDDRDRIRETLAKQNAGDIPRNVFEYRERHRDGHYIWISSKGAPDAWAPDGSPIRMIGTDTDITQRKLQEKHLRDLTHRLGLALRVSRIGVFERNLKSGELFWDDRIREIYGFPRELGVVTSAYWERTLHPEDATRILRSFNDAIAERGTFREKYRIIRPGGEIRTVAVDATYFEDTDGTPKLIGATADITGDVALSENLRKANILAEARNAELEAAKARIENQALHDALTGLPNRRYLDEIIAKFAERDQDAVHSGMAVLHIDLDRFKQINDTLGHIAGDAVLKHVARLLSEAAGTGNFVARVGGDEFVVVCWNQTDPQKLSILADGIIAAIQRPIPYEGHFCRVGASIGISIEAGPTMDPKRVLINGDMALYRAKERGKNRHEFFSKALQEELESNKRVADDILRGIEQVEFVPYYQPLVDARTYKAISVEALVRWCHPSDGVLTPDRFIEIAEDLNVLAAIDRDVLSTAKRDFERWQSDGLPIQSVSVNVSFRRLSDEDLIPALRKLKIQPGTISFEFLETIFLDEFDDRVARNIDAIKKMGIGIDVDDFGTGHTSFVSLLRLMPRRFKIDRQLIKPVATSASQRRLVASIVDIGRTLGIKVVAEGVETMEQARVLGEIGCDFLQGYAFARPMPARELERWLGGAPGL
jgi:diguanylate cyclase (GGDEF)-like protein/PAS domain S-box-containing protein